jgi:acetylornithine/N-succinyldiaminopimelate aminotransferase
MDVLVDAMALVPTYPPFPFVLTGAAGDQVFDEHGRAWIDLYGGHCVCSTGHNHPRVVTAITEQASRVLFYSTAAKLSIREEAADALATFSGMPWVFFCNSGAEANENALKLAVKITGRSGLVAMRGGWHGRTTLALSVTDDPPLHQGLESVLQPVTLLPLNDPEALAAADFSKVAAVILEPIQSMAGVRCASREYLQALRDKCSSSGTLLVFDEVQTGFGRLGAPFAVQHFGVQPDMVSCAKGIASGVPMGALLMSERVKSRLDARDLGSTFGGGPLACAALLATLDVIAEERLMPRAQALFAVLRERLRGTAVTEVLGAGLLIGLRAGKRAAALKQHLLEQRILVGASHDPGVLRLMPPLVLTNASVDAFVKAVSRFEVTS